MWLFPLEISKWKFEWNSFVLGIEIVRFAGIPKRSMYNVTLLKGLPRTGAIYPMLVKANLETLAVLKEPSDNLPSIKKPNTPSAAYQIFSYQPHAMKFLFYWRHLSWAVDVSLILKVPKQLKYLQWQKRGASLCKVGTVIIKEGSYSLITEMFALKQPRCKMFQQWYIFGVFLLTEIWREGEQ